MMWWGALVPAQPWTQKAELLPPDPLERGGFGRNVAISGDTAIIGAPGGSSGGYPEFPDPVVPSAAYVFVRSFGVWTLQQKLVPSITVPEVPYGDSFGAELAISGDTALVSATARGCVYVFARVGGVWTEQQRLTSPVGGTDFYGTSVSISGDTAVVGAYWDDGAGDNLGAAYVYERAGGAWILQQKLVASDAGDQWYFGRSLGISGDTLVVSAYGEVVKASYVFTRTAGVWTEVQKLTSPESALQDLYAWDLALDGDTFVVGAPWDDQAGPNAGAAYVYARSGSTWAQQAKLMLPGPSADSGFGSLVDIDGDTIFVQSTQGRCVFQRSGGVWDAGTYPLLAGGQPLSTGRSGALSDGTLIIGKSDTAVGGLPEAGNAYVFERRSSATAPSWESLE